MITFNSKGATGNIFYVLSEARKIMQKERRITEYNNMWEEVQKCESYEAALEIIGQHIPLHDTATGKEYGNV